MRVRVFSVGVLLMVLSMVSCGKPQGIRVSGSTLSDNAYESPWYYFNTVHALGIEVFYEPGAEPSVGMTDTDINSMPEWQILEDNVRSLYYGRDLLPVFDIPKTLDQMTVLESQNKESWTDEDLYRLATQVRKLSSTEGEAHFVILYLKGNYSDGTSLKPKTLGVFVGATSVIAIFKDVVKLGESDPYTEQATLVHEMGHALGLVNNGLPFIQDHEDHDHATHCSNPNCVMHWTNSDSTAPQKFWEKITKTGEVLMFGDECLKDTRLYRLDEDLK